MEWDDWLGVAVLLAALNACESSPNQRRDDWYSNHFPEYVHCAPFAYCSDRDLERRRGPR